MDASALAKRYVAESGTPLVNHVFKHVPRDRLMCLGVGTLEVISILVRKKNAQLLLPAVYQQAMLDFRSEVVDAADFAKIAVTAVVISDAVPLIEKHSVNATDGLILATALSAAALLRDAAGKLV